MVVVSGLRVEVKMSTQVSLKSKTFNPLHLHLLKQLLESALLGKGHMNFQFYLFLEESFRTALMDFKIFKSLMLFYLIVNFLLASTSVLTNSKPQPANLTLKTLTENGLWSWKLTRKPPMTRTFWRIFHHPMRGDAGENGPIAEKLLMRRISESILIISN